MPRKLLRKLVDIATRSGRLQFAIENFLTNHSLRWEKHEHQSFIRYYVHADDLKAARAALPGLEEMARGGRDVA